MPAPSGEPTGKDLAKRGTLGTNRRLVVDRTRQPRVVNVSGANVHDLKLLEDAIPPLRLPDTRRGRTRKRPVKLHADRGTTVRAAIHQAFLAVGRSLIGWHAGNRSLDVSGVSKQMRQPAA